MLLNTTQTSFWGVSFEQWKVILGIATAFLILLGLMRIAYCIYMKHKYQPGKGEIKEFHMHVNNLEPYGAVLAKCLRELPANVAHARITKSKFDPTDDGTINASYTIEYYVKASPGLRGLFLTTYLQYIYL